MRTSEQIELVSAALVAAQAEFKPVEKGAENPFFHSKYATLTSIVEATSPILEKHGLMVTQLPDFDGTFDLLTTRILHVSGQWIEASMRLHMAKASAQEQGSAITYARRYAYSGGLGLVTEVDDDGNDASGTTKRQGTRATAAPRQSAAQAARPHPNAETGELLSPDQKAKIMILFGELGYGGDRGKRIARTIEVIERDVQSVTELTKAEASKLIDALQTQKEAG